MALRVIRIMIIWPISDIGFGGIQGATDNQPKPALR